jgi:hypothetical protein
VNGEISHTGTSSIRAAGNDNAASGGSYYYFRVFDVNIPINANTKLSFWTYPTNNISRYVTVDLVMTDGTTLRDCGATDQHGASMHPGAGHGTVNSWQRIVCNVGTWLNGKTIDRIMIAYDHAADTGSFKTYFDDIVISDTAQALRTAAATDTAFHQQLNSRVQLSQQVQVFPQPASNTAILKFSNGWKGVGYVTILTAAGGTVGRQLINIDGGQASVPVSQLPGGLYFLRINKEQQVITQKMMVLHE